MNWSKKLIALLLLSTFFILPFRTNARIQDDFPTLQQGLYYKYTSEKATNDTSSILDYSIITFEITYYVEKVENNYAEISSYSITYVNGTKVDEGKGLFGYDFSSSVISVNFAFNITNLQENIWEVVIGMVLNESQLSFTESTYDFKGENRTVYRVFYNYTELSGVVTRIRNMIIDKETGLILEDTRIHIDRTNYTYNYTIQSYRESEHMVLIDTNFFDKPRNYVIYIIIIVIIAIPITWLLLWKRKKQKA
ncbi:MAG: hypothetical protein ACP6IQ_06335 [Candidatus Njordarchaeia archaeon]